MEQRIGSGSRPLEGAGFDPAFIPGLSSPASVAPEDVKKEDAAEEAVSERAVSEKTVLETARDETSEEASDEAETEPDEEAPVDGPVFEAADRRARIVADHKGVRLSLDDQECEFRWDEIGAVETETARFGKRYTVTVHTPDRRWYPIEIEATARSRFKEWDEQLDAVLDAYFDDGAEEADAEAADAEEADVR
ncbi:hypothetical protein [Streptomyces viridochromogenes]|uniref:Uncharacterized protein n=1 Tax=Streptomyces viridochromogenes Tue57 TaxID=1160705 RepID=L8PIH9_STRVR|nr:hypothetical protein [Streptomyces viridochromogenes]ELS56044.1 hypothetical protein STVIR_2977 [Streptomyces viridochromogenes Tue57]